MSSFNKKLLAGLAIIIIGLLIVAQRQGRTIHGKVISVSDGDTITVLQWITRYKVRLYGIDCPEKRQAFGSKAKELTSQLAFGKTVDVEIQTKDRYGRYVGTVILPDGMILNHELIKQGFAWHYRRYSNDNHLQTLEDQARREKLGLWAQPSPQPPWEFRHPH